MKPAFPHEVSLRLIAASKDAGREGNLRAGASVSIVVLERRGSELYRVAIGQNILSAVSTSPLEIGAVLKARVERLGGAILLRLESPSQGQTEGASGRDSLSALLRAASLPDDPSGRLAAAALLREGLSPDLRSLGRVRRASLREGADGGWTDLAAQMEAKGLPAEDTPLAALVDLAQGRGQGGRGEGWKQGQEGPEVEEGELPRVLGELLRQCALRSAEESGIPSQDSLALFNHLRGPEGSWVIVPFCFSLDAVDFSGSFRIHLPWVRGGQGLFEARFSVSRGTSSRFWSFLLSFGGGRVSSLRVDAPDISDKGLFASQFEGFGAELALLGCRLRLSSRDEGVGENPPDARAAGLAFDA